MRGKPIRLSPMRRFICELLHAASAVPTVPVQRRMRLAEVVAARLAQQCRIPWVALFMKAYAQVAETMPELRRAYVKFPWPHLYEYPTSVASLAVEREYAGEHVVVFGRFKNPAGVPLVELGRIVDSFGHMPLEECHEFRQMLRLSTQPWPLRRLLWWLGLNLPRQRARYFGTFALSVYSGLGAESLHPLSPLTSILNYGVIAADGAVDVRICYDHRVMDGATVARALSRMESQLTGSLLTELRSTATRKRYAA